MKQIIILNAPPGAGKDTIGGLVKDYSPVPLRTLSFKKPMFEIAQAMLGDYYFGLFMAAYDNRDEKEKPLAILNGLTPRQFMIWISETVIKPQFGDQYFGRRFVEEARRDMIPVICTDGGFPSEIKPLISAGFKVDVCRLHRSGYTFEGDSRDYLNLGAYHHRYSEHDFLLISGDPMHTVNEIINKFLK